MVDKRELVESYIGVIYHFFIKDKLDFHFCAGIILQDTLIDITGDEVAEYFCDYFKREMGMAPFEECPLCKAKTTVRYSSDGFFVGCSTYPECDFLASKEQPFTTKEEYLQRLEEEAKIIDKAKELLRREGKQLYGWMLGNSKVLRRERDLIKDYIGFEDRLHLRAAKGILTKYKKAKNLGYPKRDPSLYKDKLTEIFEYTEKQVDSYYNGARRKNPEISREEAREEYAAVFRTHYGISFDDSCPMCGSPLKMLQQLWFDSSGLEHYIGCSNYPQCEFIANSYYKVLTDEEIELYKQLMNKIKGINNNTWVALGRWLESQRGKPQKEKFPNWHIALNRVKDITQRVNARQYVPIERLNILLNILEDAKAFGFECG